MSVPRLVDAVVVGGGIVGAAAAFELARSGLGVALLERANPNRESSGATAGNFHIQPFPPFRAGRPTPSPDLVPFQHAAAAAWRTVEAEIEADIEYRRCGGVTVAESGPELEMLKAKHALGTAAGIESELLGGEEVRRLEPALSVTVLGALHCPEDGYANALAATPAYLAAAVRHGATVHPFTAVDELRRRGSDWVVGSESESWLSSCVVDAAGAWMDEVAALAGVEIEMRASALQMLVTEPAPPSLTHLVQHVAQGLTVKQMATGRVLIGGGWPALALDLDGRSLVSAESVVGSSSLARRVLPFLANARLQRAWAGPYSVTPDGRPVLGELSSAPGLYLVGSPYGFTLAPLLAKLLVGIIEGRASQLDVTGCHPDRLVRSSRPVGAGETAELEAP